MPHFAENIADRVVPLPFKPLTVGHVEMQRVTLLRERLNSITFELMQLAEFLAAEATACQAQGMVVGMGAAKVAEMQVVCAAHQLREARQHLGVAFTHMRQLTQDAGETAGEPL